MANPGNGTRHEARGTRGKSPAPRTSRPEAALVIFAKAPIPGQVKTRLSPPLTPDEAASLHGSFVLDMLERSSRLAKPTQGKTKAAALDRFLACTPSSEHVFFKVMEERQGVRLIDQIGEDLGARMRHAFDAVFALGYQRVLLVGTDLPTLPESSFAQALTLLGKHDLVLGPSFDGGYFLIALTRPSPELFTGIPWSTDQVCAQTQKKADDLGLRTALLPAWRDVDTIADLRAIIEEAGLEARGKGQEAKTGSTEKTRPRASRHSPHALPLSARTAGVLRLLSERLEHRDKG
jgi:rSAM/selenodomain-associated transferase 1